MAYYSFIRVQEVYTINVQISFIFLHQYYKMSIFEFLINYEKTALQICFFNLQGCSLVVTGETDQFLGMVVRVSFS